MISYLRQVAVCKAALETIKQSLSQSNDMGIRTKIINIPTTESILRVVSVLPDIATEEQLKAFIIEHTLSNLRLTDIQREKLRLTF